MEDELRKASLEKEMWDKKYEEAKLARDHFKQEKSAEGEIHAMKTEINRMMVSLSDYHSLS